MVIDDAKFGVMPAKLLQHYRIVKTFGGKKGWRIRTIGSVAEKRYGELKSICIGNVMEIMKIGKKLIIIANCCNLPKFSLPMFFTVWYLVTIKE